MTVETTEMLTPITDSKINKFLNFLLSATIRIDRKQFWDADRTAFYLVVFSLQNALITYCGLEYLNLNE